MKQRSFFILFVMFGLTAFAAAQAITVTNSDLENFREKRLKAEREYRENYARLGMSSPDELELRRIEDLRQVDESLARIAANRSNREAMMQESLRLMNFIRNLDARYKNTPYQNGYDLYYGGPFIYGGGFSFYRPPLFKPGRFTHRRPRTTWRVGGGFINETGGRSGFIHGIPQHMPPRRSHRP